MVEKVQERKDEDLDPGSGDENGENILRSRIGSSQMSGIVRCRSQGWLPWLESGGLCGPWSHQLRQRQWETELVWILGLCGIWGTPRQKPPEGSGGGVSAGDKNLEVMRMEEMGHSVKMCSQKK